MYTRSGTARDIGRAVWMGFNIVAFTLGQTMLATLNTYYTCILALYIYTYISLSIYQLTDASKHLYIYQNFKLISAQKRL